MESIEQGWELNNRDVEGDECNLEYQVIEVVSFKEAVEGIEKNSKGKKRFCIVDVDGTMIGNEITQYPWLCYFEKPEIGEDVMESFPTLVERFCHNNLCIGTNRDPRITFPWASKDMMLMVEEYLNQFGIRIPTFTRLNKQIANTRVGRDKRNDLADYIIDYVRENDVEDRLTVYSIQDLLPVYFKIDIFPKVIARTVIEGVRQRLGRDLSVEIKDYVIRK
jgi:hypothetical protein